MNTKPLPPVGCPVMVRNSDGAIVLCAVTHSPMRSTGRTFDANRRIEVVGINAPTFRVGGIIHRDENVYGARIWYFECEPSVEGSEPVSEPT